jgi:hypothetical protein
MAAIKHPLGAGANPRHNNRTEHNRRALEYCLRLYFQQALDDDQINKKEGTSPCETGVPLADKFTSRLEIAISLDKLQKARPDLYVLTIQQYKQEMTRNQISRLLHISPTTVGQQVTEALNLLIDEIWQDE